MTLHWPNDSDWLALRDSVEPGISSLLEHCEFHIHPATDDDPLMSLTDDGMRLHPGLTVPELRHPRDQTWMEEQDVAVAPLALDRWRRCIGLILEAVELHSLAQELGQAPSELPMEWWSVGLAAEGVDRALPALGWLWPEAVDLLAHPEQGLNRFPRRGAWFFRWLHLQGLEQPPLGSDGIELSMEHWLAFGRWTRDRGRGPASLSPIPIPRAPHVHRTEAWTSEAPALHPVLLRGGPTGMKPVCEGGVLEPSTPLSADEEVAALVGVLDPGVLSVRDQRAGPVVNWTLLSGGLGAKIGSGRGVEMQLLPDGQLCFVMANAFLGLMEGRLLSMAEKFGVSGEAPGRWRVMEMDDEGRSGTLLFEGLDPTGLSVHPRGTSFFALPAKTWMEPVRRALSQLEDQPLKFTMDPELEEVDLLIEAQIRDSAAELRFGRALERDDEET